MKPEIVSVSLSSLLYILKYFFYSKNYDEYLKIPGSHLCQVPPKGGMSSCAESCSKHSHKGQAWWHVPIILAERLKLRIAAGRPCQKYLSLSLLCSLIQNKGTGKVLLCKAEFTWEAQIWISSQIEQGRYCSIHK